jgi:alanine-synthesizing transaminase
MFSKRTNWNLEENAYTRALRGYREAGKQIFDLTASNPTTCGFQYDETAILEALRDPASLRYQPEPKGMLTAREAVAGYYRERASVDVDPERLILTTGTSEAYSFLFRLLCEPGDEVLIAHPSYPLFEFLAEIQDVRLRPFQIVYDHGWQIDFHSLRQGLNARARAIVLVHPNNPTGHFTADCEADELNAICAQHELALIVDEVFLDYELRAAPHKKRHGTFMQNDAALTFVLSGLSKIAALPQMKVGWIAASGPAELARESMARLEVIADTYLSLNAPLQCALPALLAQCGAMQKQVMERVESNLAELDRHIARQKSVSRLEVEGGWYAVLRVPAVRSDEELAIRLLEERGVLVHPGHFYDFRGEGYLVISLLAPRAEFAEGVRALLESTGSL